MMNGSIYKKIGLIAVILIPGCLSFFVTKAFLGHDNDTEPKTNTTETELSNVNPSEGNTTETNVSRPNTAETYVSGANTSETNVSRPSTSVDTNNNLSKELVLAASQPVLKGNTYSFTASFTGDLSDPYHYEVWSNKKRIAKSENGYFSNIPATDGGTYKLCLVNENTNKNVTDAITVKGFNKITPDESDGIVDSDGIKKRITEEEFQRRMLNTNDHSLDGNKGKFVAESFRLVIVNANQGDNDFVVSDIQDVKDMIHTYNKWKSASVVGLEYDAKGYVTVAKIQAIYN